MAKVICILGALLLLGGCSAKVDEPAAARVQEKPAVQEADVEKQVTADSRSNRYGSHAPVDGVIWRGFNALQSSKVAWGSTGARQSLIKMVATGANSVVLIPFLKQDSRHATDIRQANNVTDAQLIAAIETAHQLGLKVIVKPQILVKGSWTGEIEFSHEKQRLIWFKNYSSHIRKYARLSQKQGVEAFVIGTELSKLAKELPWLPLITELRGEFRGKLSYAAHNVEGVERFPYWDKLDAIGVSLYPSLGDMGEYDEMLAHIELSLYKLKRAVKEQGGKAIWLLEIGMPSADGSSSQPWEWRSLHKSKTRPNLTMQTAAVAAWLNAVSQVQSVKAVYFWSWYSDPYAGGEHNLDYTVQNKPAEIMIRQIWNK